jgi:uncharacterized protein YraI
MAIEHIKDVPEAEESDAQAAARARTVATTAATEQVTTYPIAPGYRVNVRSGPSTSSRIVKVLAYDARVPIYCQCPGQTISGPYGTTSIWDYIGSGYVSDAYVKTGSDGYVTVRCS